MCELLQLRHVTAENVDLRVRVHAEVVVTDEETGPLGDLASNFDPVPELRERPHERARGLHAEGFTHLRMSGLYLMRLGINASAPRRFFLSCS